MSIADTINRFCTQTAVYWGTPADDGTGGKTFADPVEIQVRWEIVKTLLDTKTDRDSDQTVSEALVYTKQDVDELGWLYLGLLDDLDSSGEPDPTNVSGSYEIKQFDKIKDSRGTKYVRKAYL